MGKQNNSAKNEMLIARIHELASSIFVRMMVIFLKETPLDWRLQEWETTKVDIITTFFPLIGIQKEEQIPFLDALEKEVFLLVAADEMAKAVLEKINPQ